MVSKVFDSQGTDIPDRNGKSRKVYNGDDIYTTYRPAATKLFRIINS